MMGYHTSQSMHHVVVVVHRLRPGCPSACHCCVEGCSDQEGCSVSGALVPWSAQQPGMPWLHQRLLMSFMIRSGSFLKKAAPEERL